MKIWRQDHPLREPKLIKKTSAELLNSIYPHIWGVKFEKNDTLSGNCLLKIGLFEVHCIFQVKKNNLMTGHCFNQVQFGNRFGGAEGAAPYKA